MDVETALCACWEQHKPGEEELFLFDQIILRYDSMTSQFKGVYEQKIRTEVGVDLYNSLNQDIDTLS